MCSLAPGGHRHLDRPHQETRTVQPRTPGLALPGVPKAGFQGKGSSQVSLPPHEESTEHKVRASPLHLPSLRAPRKQESDLFTGPRTHSAQHVADPASIG